MHLPVACTPQHLYRTRTADPAKITKAHQSTILPKLTTLPEEEEAQGKQQAMQQHALLPQQQPELSLLLQQQQEQMSVLLKQQQQVFDQQQQLRRLLEKQQQQMQECVAQDHQRPSTNSINSKLPSQLLASKVLQHVSFQERMQTCALVCTAWHTASTMAVSSVSLSGCMQERCDHCAEWLQLSPASTLVVPGSTDGSYDLNWSCLRLG